VNGNVKLGHAAARSGECAQYFSDASCSISRPMQANILHNLNVPAYLSAQRPSDGHRHRAHEILDVFFPRNVCGQIAIQINRSIFIQTSH